MNYNNDMNFDDINDVRWLLSAVLDDYVPRQLEGFDSDLIYDAIQQLKFENIAITGNSLFAECCGIAIAKVRSEIQEMASYKDYNDYATFDFDENEKTIIEEYINNCKDNGKDNDICEGCIFNVYANGSLDSGIYISVFATEQYELDITALSLIHRETGLLDNLEKCGLDIGNVDSIAHDYITERQQAKDEIDYE